MKKLIPTSIKAAYRRLFPAWKGTEFNCPTCNADLKYFNPFPQFYFDLWEKHNFKWGDRQETLNVKNYKCPSCGCADRDRLAVLFFDQWSKDKSTLDILEFAPIESTKKFFSNSKSAGSYRSADLQSKLADDHVDICNMKEQYKDNSFDVIYCSHVLEHVVDDLAAMKELLRILKPSGVAMLYVPIFTELEQIYEDASVQSEEDRWREFGQNDHARLYNQKGFVERLTTTGFNVEMVGVSHFSKKLFERSGIAEGAILYKAVKV